MGPPPIKLAELLRRAASGHVPPGWLFLPEDHSDWNDDTDAYVVDDEYGEDDEQVQKRADEIGYRSTIDHQTLKGVVRAARDHLGVESFAGRLEALIYYDRFDTFLPALGAPDPPPWEETQLRLDREFYDSLGAERPGVPCRAAGCKRGAVSLSAFCKPHHFEQIQRRTCPFTD